MRRAVIALALACTLGQAHAQYVSYPDWVQFSRPNRGIYIAGLFDAFLTSSIQYGQEHIAKHFADCIQKAGLPNSTLAENMLEFARARKPIQEQPLQDIMVAYLSTFCGEPPKK